MKKTLRNLLMFIGILGVCLLTITLLLNKLISGGVLKKEDIFNYTIKCLPYLVPFLILIVIAVIVYFVTKNMRTSKRKMIRSQSLIAVGLALIFGIYGIVFNPLYSTINLALTKVSGLTDETKQAGLELNEDIAEEGIVLLKNDNHELPLKVGNLNVFGWASTNPNYGGTGSGSVDVSSAVTLLDGLSNAGYKLNKDLIDFYTSYNDKRPPGNSLDGNTNWTLPEPSVDSYSNNLIEKAKDFSNTALLVIARVGGEGDDLPTDMTKVNYDTTSPDGGHEGDFEEGQTYLELSKTEKDLVDLVTSNFKHVIVIYNGSNAFELGWIDEYDNIDAAITMSGPGQKGFNALGSILKGDVNPSGRLTDTYTYDLTKSYNFNNIGDFQFDNVEEFYDKDTPEGALFKQGYNKVSFINYIEGIYIGYKFYETAAVEGLINYDDVVQYPFGYGLSYTTFSQKMSDLSVNDSGDLSFDVTVTNTGDVAGKDVVQVYFTPPYTNGGIEKSEVNLIEFEKTDILKPGESQTLSFTFNESEMASYDEFGNRCYVLEAGDYKISIRNDSHTEIDSRVYTKDNEIVYNQNNPRPSDKIAAENEFDYAKRDVTYLSRKDHFANYEEATAAPKNFSMSDDIKAVYLNNDNYDSSKFNNKEDKMPTLGASNKVMLSDLVGLDYDDPLWEDLLDKLTIDEMVNLLGKAGFSTTAIESIGKIQTNEVDGPAGLHSFFNKKMQGNSYQAPNMLGNTWNKELAAKFGSQIGKEANEIGVNGWYGPAMNIHRSAFSGRNFEYYSEDAVLSGRIAAETVKAAQEEGIYCFLKHFALNDQEINRNFQLTVWTTEQGAREGYLRAFEYPVKEGNATAIMSSFNYIGHEWAGASNSLLNKILRDEWGFRGMVVSDAAMEGYNYINGDQAIRNGGDAIHNIDLTRDTAIKDTESATSVLAMRNATHNVLYTVANSNAYKGAESNSIATWEVIFYTCLGLVTVLMIIAEIITIIKYRKREKGIINIDSNN